MKKFLKILIIILIAVAILYFGLVKFEKTGLTILIAVIFWLICGSIAWDMENEGMPIGSYGEVIGQSVIYGGGPFSLIYEIYNSY